MRIGILPVGQLKSEATSRIQEALSIAFPETIVTIMEKGISLPDGAFNEGRNQYRSDMILTAIKEYAATKPEFDHVLGVLDVDIFTSAMNFVFGEAEHPGKVALISLWRLRPGFYHQASNEELFDERSAKEAVHEIGHTLGLMHCSNPFCVMHFSNSILETDVKKTFFCNKCSIKVERALGDRGRHVE
jgi:archaemetzincin